MSAGGFIFEKVNLAYDANTNGDSVRSWGLAVHKARCEAFLKATTREQLFGGNGWYSVQTNLYNEFSETISNNIVYIQDVFPYPSVDTTGVAPSFITFFRENSGASEYCIITSRLYHCNPNYTYDVSYGLYINKDNMPYNFTFGESMGHAFALNGFGSYDIASSSFSTTDCTGVMGSYLSCTWSNQNSSAHYETGSLLHRRFISQSDSRLVNKTFQFGFAVRGKKIICLYRELSFTGWYWSLIGEIFGNLIFNNDTHKTGAILNFYQNGTESTVMTNENSTTTSYGDHVSFTDITGVQFKGSSSYICNDYFRNICSCVCQRVNRNSPDDIYYSSVFVFSYCYANNNVSDYGVDGNGNGMKGFLDTDLIRLVSPTICGTAGATIQNDNFVVMKNFTGAPSCGVILGWDSSNESII